MSATEAQATRDELIAEYIARDAVATFENRILGCLMEGDLDIVNRLEDGAGRSDSLSEDTRVDELFGVLWPEADEVDTAEYMKASAESCYIAARILRAAVYSADVLRQKADQLLELHDRHLHESAELAAKEKAGGDDA